MKLRAIRTGNYAQWERRQQDAVTLIELIGSMAVIAFLVAMACPTITELIERSKVNNTVTSYLSLKTAIGNHLNQYQVLNSYFGTNVSVPIVNYDTTILLPEGFLDKKFSPGCGGPNAIVQLVAGSASNNGQGYFLGGITNCPPASCTLNFSLVVECILTNLSYLDAGSISVIIDQGQFNPGLDGFLDSAGKMDYSTNNGGILRIFLMGR